MRDAGRFERFDRQNSRGTRRPPKTGGAELCRVQPGKSKQFQRYGPLMLSLRKADTKHKNFGPGDDRRRQPTQQEKS